MIHFLLFMSAAASFELLMLEYNSLKHVNNAAFEEYQTWRESRRNYKNTRLSRAQIAYRESEVPLTEAYILGYVSSTFIWRSVTNCC